jgi:hypothetical protein
MKVKYIFTLLAILCVISFPRNSEAEKGKLSVGLDIGAGWHDLGADETAQTLANLSGQTVAYTYDEATFVGRLFADYGFSEDFLVELGLFKSADLDATYTFANGATVTEEYSAFGADAAIVYSPSKMPFFVKGGAHISKIFGEYDLVIGGTTYASAWEAQSGVGWLAGAGFEGKTGMTWRAGFTYYGNLGGSSAADVGFLYVGYKF